MFSPITKGIALRYFHRAIRTGSVEDATLAWELMHLDAILGPGAFLPNPDDPGPWPGPGGPRSEPETLVTPEIAVELIRAAGDPNPQPSAFSPFSDLSLRLDAAVRLRDRLTKSVETLDEVIESLRGQNA
ncbi:MAG: hypothetical protein WCA30_14200 [Dermatophilaceae bacterium]